MLKKRIAAGLIIRDGIVVQSIGFRKYLPVGRAEIAVEALNNWGIDEIILLDISATRAGRRVDTALVRRVAPFCFVPLTVGGGITTLQEVDELIHTGADKVSINAAIRTNPSLITDIAHKYGDQCVIASCDAIRTDESPEPRLYDYQTGTILDESVADWAKRMEGLGAGELLINCVHKDGQYSGFDISLYQALTSIVHIPVIAMGGAGHAGHYAELFAETDVAAGCAGNFFHFSEHSVNTTKAALRGTGLDTRIETYADYSESSFDAAYRLRKKADSTLEEMLYIKIEKETI